MRYIQVQFHSDRFPVRRVFAEKIGIKENDTLSYQQLLQLLEMHEALQAKSQIQQLTRGGQHEICRND